MAGQVAVVNSENARTYRDKRGVRNSGSFCTFINCTNVTNSGTSCDIKECQGVINSGTTCHMSGCRGVTNSGSNCTITRCSYVRDTGRCTVFEGYSTTAPKEPDLPPGVTMINAIPYYNNKPLGRDCKEALEERPDLVVFLDELHGMEPFQALPPPVAPVRPLRPAAAGPVTKQTQRKKRPIFVDLVAEEAKQQQQKKEKKPVLPEPIPGEEDAKDGLPTCVMCERRARTAMYMPCTHDVACVTCAIEYHNRPKKEGEERTCPYCEQPYKRVVRKFIVQ